VPAAADRKGIRGGRDEAFRSAVCGQVRAGEGRARGERMGLQVTGSLSRALNQRVGSVGSSRHVAAQSKQCELAVRKTQSDLPHLVRCALASGISADAR